MNPLTWFGTKKPETTDNDDIDINQYITTRKLEDEIKILNEQDKNVIQSELGDGLIVDLKESLVTLGDKSTIKLNNEAVTEEINKNPKSEQLSAVISIIEYIESKKEYFADNKINIKSLKNYINTQIKKNKNIFNDIDEEEFKRATLNTKKLFNVPPMSKKDLDNLKQNVEIELKQKQNDISNLYFIKQLIDKHSQRNTIVIPGKEVRRIREELLDSDRRKRGIEQVLPYGGKRRRSTKRKTKRSKRKQKRNTKRRASHRRRR